MSSETTTVESAPTESAPTDSTRSIPPVTPDNRIGVTFIPINEREPAPEIAGLDLDLNELALSDVAGDVTVVNAWASWCPPCIEEMPELIATQKATKKLGATFLGLNVTDDLESAREFGAALTYPSIADPEGRLLSLVPGIPSNGLPSTLIIDSNGDIAVRIIGPITREVLTALIIEVGGG